MAYADAAAMKALVGSTRLQRLLPDFDAGTFDARLDAALADASGAIDGQLASVYATPLALAGIADATQKAAAEARLRNVTIALALEVLALGIDELPKSWLEAAKAAHAWLDSVAQRKARVPGLSSLDRPIARAFAATDDEAPGALDDALFEALLY